jgi:eukaryotic-like serine/threonine-protein kinase
MPQVDSNGPLIGPAEPPKPELVERIFTPPTEGERITSNATGNTYRIGRVIGEGSFGVVYECTDTWENELAVKILKPQGSYEQVRDNAIAELQKLQTLRHPNVTYVYDGFEFRHTFYIVFERCWEPINQFIQRENFKGHIWLRAMARQLLQAVHFLHCSDYVHQDIHGGNVFVATVRDDMAPSEMIFSFMLGDLGITKMVTEMDAANTVLAEWMRAPEALHTAEFGRMDHRMDIYHCGLLFLQVLIGGPLTFTREDVLRGAPRELALQVGGTFSFALEKALRRHVEYRTVLERPKYTSASCSQRGVTFPSSGRFLTYRLQAPVTSNFTVRFTLTVRPLVRSTQPFQQACRVAVEDRSAGFAHATESGAPTTVFALPRQRAKSTSARARSAEQPRTAGAFANRASVAPALHASCQLFIAEGTQ